MLKMKTEIITGSGFDDSYMFEDHLLHMIGKYFLKSFRNFFSHNDMHILRIPNVILLSFQRFSFLNKTLADNIFPCNRHRKHSTNIRPILS